MGANDSNLNAAALNLQAQPSGQQDLDFNSCHFNMNAGQSSAQSITYPQQSASSHQPDPFQAQANYQSWNVSTDNAPSQTPSTTPTAAAAYAPDQKVGYKVCRDNIEGESGLERNAARMAQGKPPRGRKPGSKSDPAKNDGTGKQKEKRERAKAAKAKKNADAIATAVNQERLPHFQSPANLAPVPAQQQMVMPAIQAHGVGALPSTTYTALFGKQFPLQPPVVEMAHGYSGVPIPPTLPPSYYGQDTSQQHFMTTASYDDIGEQLAAQDPLPMYTPQESFSFTAENQPYQPVSAVAMMGDATQQLTPPASSPSTSEKQQAEQPHLPAAHEEKTLHQGDSQECLKYDEFGDFFAEFS